MKKGYIHCIVVFISYLLFVSYTYAAGETITWWYNYVGYTSTLEEGDWYIEPYDITAQNSESYSRIGLAEEYDPGYWEDFWTVHLRSDTSVQTSQGRATAWSQTPASVDSSIALGSVILDLNQSVEAIAWTSTQSVYSPVTTETVTIGFNSGFSSFNLSPGLEGSVTIYFGIWEDEITAGNLMLDEKEGWSASQFQFNGTQYSLLEKIYTPSASPTGVNWVLDFQAGHEYTFFTYMVAETVPEPTALLMLGTGAFLIRRKSR
jgi:hypothetical protein